MCGPPFTASVASLISDSSLPVSSVKVTRTRMALPKCAFGQGVGRSRRSLDMLVRPAAGDKPLITELHISQPVRVLYA